MQIGAKLTIILIAEDDPEDRLLMKEAFEEAKVPGCLRFVEDGEILMDYLLRRGPYSDSRDAPRPDLIFLDLNMPRKDGREALREIKSHPKLSSIPVVVLSTSVAEVDIVRTYDDGVNSYIAKPANFDQLVEVIRTMQAYWFNLVALPPTD